jgi:ribosomal protein L44E
MPNRQLTSEEREVAKRILNETKQRISALSKNDADLEWSMRRYIYKQLIYGERRPPMVRRALKTKLRSKQNGLCPLCGEQLPEKNAVLDRLEAMKGYTEDNTRLLCPSCDKKVQEQRRYA